MALSALLGAAGGLLGGIFGGNSAKKAADKAAQLQYQAAQDGIAETRRQFDLTRGDFASEQALGEAGIDRYMALSGMAGDEAQMAEIEALRNSPLYQSIYRNGEEAILATASATGGLRGGNTQDALARFGGDALSQVIQEQLARYSGAIGVGLGSDQAIGNFGANAVASNNASRNFGAQAQGQAALVRGGVNAQNWNNFGSLLGELGKVLKF